MQPYCNEIIVPTDEDELSAEKAHCSIWTELDSDREIRDKDADDAIVWMKHIPVTARVPDEALIIEDLL